MNISFIKYPTDRFSMKNFLLFFGFFIVCFSSCLNGNESWSSICQEELNNPAGKIVQSVAPSNCVQDSNRCQETCKCWKDYFSGFYAGLGGGLQYLSGDLQINKVIDLLFINTDVRTVEKSYAPFSDLFGDVEIYLGGGLELYNRFYCGIEGFAKNNLGNDLECSIYLNDKIIQQNTPEVKVTFSNPRMVIRRAYEIGGLVRVGFFPNPKTMIYLLFGLEATKFHFKEKQDFTILEINLFKNAMVRFHEWKAGVMPGIGLETMIIDNLSFRTEFTYSFYGSIRKKNTVTSEIAFGESNVLGSIQQMTHMKELSVGAFVVSLCYYFGR